jgi:hypothetical protein
MKALLLICLSVFHTQIYAQTIVNKSVVCMETPDLLKAISGSEIGEKPQWVGKSEAEDSNFVLFVNTKTKSWTMVQLNEKIACILGTGLQSTDVQYTPVKRQM